MTLMVRLGRRRTKIRSPSPTPPSRSRPCLRMTPEGDSATGLIPDTQREPVSRWPRDGGGRSRSTIMANRSLHPRGGRGYSSASRAAALTSSEKTEEWRPWRILGEMACCRRMAKNSRGFGSIFGQIAAEPLGGIRQGWRSPPDLAMMAWPGIRLA